MNDIYKENMVLRKTGNTDFSTKDLEITTTFTNESEHPTTQHGLHGSLAEHEGQRV